MDITLHVSQVNDRCFAIAKNDAGKTFDSGDPRLADISVSHYSSVVIGHVSEWHDSGDFAMFVEGNPCGFESEPAGAWDSANGKNNDIASHLRAVGQLQDAGDGAAMTSLPQRHLEESTGAIFSEGTELQLHLSDSGETTEELDSDTPGGIVFHKQKGG